MISFLIPTCGRDSILETIESIDCWPGDEIVIVGKPYEHIPEHPFIRYVSCELGHDWGHAERNFAMPLCRGRYIAHIDDDDHYAPRARWAMHKAICDNPNKPILFRMQFPNGLTLWQEQVIRCGNVGTPMMLLPNEPTKFGTWGSFVGGDCHFLETSGWAESEYAWRPEIIALLGHNT